MTLNGALVAGETVTKFYRIENGYVQFRIAGRGWYRDVLWEKHFFEYWHNSRFRCAFDLLPVFDISRANRSD